MDPALYFTYAPEVAVVIEDILLGLRALAAALASYRHAALAADEIPKAMGFECEQDLRLALLRAGAFGGDPRLCALTYRPQAMQAAQRLADQLGMSGALVRELVTQAFAQVWDAAPDTPAARYERALGMVIPRAAGAARASGQGHPAAHRPFAGAKPKTAR